ncbi:MAG: DedA family protein [Solirubrobacteraceae bacterium]|nr:DedA family protein [Solirubrobacteraceae bacterium]
MAAAIETFAVTETVSQIIRDLGLLGLVALMFVENVFPPIPSEVVLPLAGFFVGRGELSFVGVLLAATLGSVLGSVFLYEMARYGGRPFVLRYGSILRVEPEDLDRADAWFERRGPVIVLVGRCIPGVRSLVSLPAGTLKMPRVQYIALTLVGSLVWNAALIGAGWLLGEEWDRVSDAVGAVGTPLLVVVLLLLGIASLVWWWRRHPSRRAD